LAGSSAPPPIEAVGYFVEAALGELPTSVAAPGWVEIHQARELSTA
jgi:hypothetical protein